VRETSLSHLKIRRMAVNNVNMVIAYGECDICSAQLLKDMMADTIGEGEKKLVVDIKNLRYIDSSGLAAMLWARHKIEEQGGRLVVIGLNGNLHRAFIPFGDMLETADSLNDAIDMLGSGAESARF